MLHNWKLLIGQRRNLTSEFVNQRVLNKWIRNATAIGLSIHTVVQPCSLRR